MFHFDLNIDYHFDHRDASGSRRIYSEQVIQLVAAFGWDPGATELLYCNDYPDTVEFELPLDHGPAHRGFIAALHRALEASEASPENRLAVISVNDSDCCRSCDETRLLERGDMLNKYPAYWLRLHMQMLARSLH